MKRFPTRWLRRLVALLVLVTGALLGVHFYLSSRSVANQVARQGQSLLQAPVEVGRVSIGLFGSSTIEGFTLHQPGDPEGEPLLSVAQIRANLSALGVLTGARPDHIQLTQAHLTLRFNEKGALVTRLPHPAPTGGATPTIHLDDSEVTLAQAGRPEMILHNVQGRIQGDGSGIVLQGGVRDDYWGNWTVQIRLDTPGFEDAPGARSESNSTAAEHGIIYLDLQTEDVAVTQEKLEALPWVPAHVWREVQAEGRTPVYVRLHWPLGEGADSSRAESEVFYRVECKPVQTRVHVTAIDLTANEATGTVVIENGRVRLAGVHGKATGGDIFTEGELDFDGPQSQMQFYVNVRGLVLSQLPAKWKIPEQIDGRLNGWADLRLLVHDNRIETRGSGQGVVTNSTLAGFPTKEPIRLSLHADPDGRGFRIRASTQVGSAEWRVGSGEWRVASRERERPSASALLASTLLSSLATRHSPLATSSPSTTHHPPFTKQKADAPQADGWSLGQLAGTLVRGAGVATERAGAVANRFFEQLGRLQRGPGPGETPTYLEANLGLEDIDLAEFLKRLKIQPPVPVSGRVSFSARVGFPVDKAGDVAAYRVHGKVSLSTFSVAGFTLTDVQGKIDFARGVLRLDGLQGKMPRGKGETPGTFSGSAQLGVSPPGDLSVRLQVDNLPLDVFLSRLPGGLEEARGLVSGLVEASAPMNRVTDAAAWKATAAIRAPRLDVYGLTLSEVETGVGLDRGLAVLSDLKAKLEGADVTGSGSLHLTGTQQYRARVQLEKFPLTKMEKLAPSFRPPLPIMGQVGVHATAEGTLRPNAFKVAGSASGRDLLVGHAPGRSGAKVDTVAFNWSVQPDKVQVTDIRTHLYEGAITGNVSLPLLPAGTGKADLRVKDVDIGAAFKDAAALSLKLSGKASGPATATIPATGAEGNRDINAQAVLEAPVLRVQGIPINKARLTLELKGGTGTYRLEGESLGGRVKLNGKLPLGKTAGAAEKVEPVEKGPDGQLEVSGGAVGQLVAAYGLRETLGDLRGLLSVELPFRLTGPAGSPTGRGRLEVQNLRRGTTTLAETIRANLILEKGELQVRSLRADLAGGQVRADLGYRFTGQGGGWFTITLSQVEAEQLLGLFPGMERLVQGPMDLHLRGRLNGEWNGDGTATLTRGRVLGVEVGEWQVPLTFALAPNRGRLEVQVRDSGAQVGQGRVRMNAEVHRDVSGVRLDGRLFLFDAQLSSLAGALGDISSYAQGRVSGRIDFSGSEMRSVNDLQANVQASLQQAQAMQLPVLRQLTPFLMPGRGNATFDRGELQGRLAGGIFRVRRFSLRGTWAEVFMEGTVTLASRLDLEVTARTANIAGLDPLVLRVLSLRVPAVGPLPLATISQVSRLLSNRVVHLHVTGTVRNPTVNVEPIRLLSEEAVRFFLERAVLGLPATP